MDSGHSGWRKNSGVGKAGGDEENLIGIMMIQVPLANGSPYRREMRYLTLPGVDLHILD